MNYTLSQIAQIIGASSFADSNTHKQQTAHPFILLTDSRSLTYAPYTLFFALQSQHNDGHLYLSELYQKGVRYFIVHQSYQANPELKEAYFLKVDKVQTALQQLASYHRSQYNIPLIALTGSKGKTIIKEWLYQLLRSDFNITRSPRSYNSQIGVPLSVWDIKEETELAIIEAGISGIR